MRHPASYLPALVLGVLAACGPGRAPAPASTPQAAVPAEAAAADPVRDIHSFARPEEARVTHVELDLSADAEGEWGQALARRIYRQARPTHHPVSTNTLDAIVR